MAAKKESVTSSTQEEEGISVCQLRWEEEEERRH